MATATTTVSGQQTIPTILEPYFTGAGTAGKADFVPGLLPTAQSLFSRGYSTVYQPVQDAGLLGAGRVAGLSPIQQDLGTQLKQMGTPSQFGTANQYANQASAGLGSLLNASSMNANYSPNAQGASMTAAQTGFQPNLKMYQMDAPEQFTGATAQRYMDPYMQNVTDIAKRNAILDAQKNQLAGNLSAGRKGSLGSSGNILASTERERQLGLQLGDIQARGLESAYQNAQTQFERDRAAQMGVGQQNLQAALGVQQLGTQTGLQTALANLNNQQQAQVQNLAAQLQTQGLNAQQALQVALANQSSALQSQQQRIAAAQGLGGLAATTGQLGVAQQAADIDRLKTLGAYGDLERATAQQKLDSQYQDILRQIGYPEEQLGKMANILRGVPLGDTTSTQATTTPAPSFASQLAGMGLSGLSLYNMLKG